MLSYSISWQSISSYVSKLIWWWEDKLFKRAVLKLWSRNQRWLQRHRLPTIEYIYPAMGLTKRKQISLLWLRSLALLKPFYELLNH